MEEAPLVSIIIPFYNEERYLERAVLSALRQSYNPVEIILVNDGSEDDSLSIAQTLAATYQNIILIDTGHHSLGRARNIGLGRAKGIYVTFLDSDDELHPDAVSKMTDRMIGEDSDIVVSRFEHLDYNGTSKFTEGWKRSDPDPSVCACGMYEHMLASTAWAKLYKSSLAKQIAFPEGLWFEDRPFLLRYFLLAKKVSFEEAALWRIYSRPESITRRIISARRIEDTCRIFLEELAAAEQKTAPQRLKQVLYRHHLGALMNTFLILCSDRHKVQHLLEVQGVFDLWLNDLLTRLETAGIRIGVRDRLDIALMQSHKWLGWRCSYQLASVIKGEKINAIAALRNV